MLLVTQICNDSLGARPRSNKIIDVHDLLTCWRHMHSVPLKLCICQHISHRQIQLSGNQCGQDSPTCWRAHQQCRLRKCLSYLDGLPLCDLLKETWLAHDISLFNPTVTVSSTPENSVTLPEDTMTGEDSLQFIVILNIYHVFSPFIRQITKKSAPAC